MTTVMPKTAEDDGNNDKDQCEKQKSSNQPEMVLVAELSHP